MLLLDFNFKRMSLFYDFILEEAINKLVKYVTYCLVNSVLAHCVVS
jgi:hypothetical protein